MKKATLITLLLTLAVLLSAASVGKIRFLLGEAQYKDTQSKPFKPATLHMQVSSEGFIKTGPDATVEIQWTNGTVSIINANTQQSVSKLLAVANTNPNWKNKMWDRVNGLKLQNNRAESTAGIRRDEAEVKKESQLYWFVDTPPNIEEAIAFFEAKDFTKAIPIFEEVITYSPLNNEAELSHAYLIMIFDETGDKINMKKHIELLKTDFPNSSTLDSLPPETE